MGRLVDMTGMVVGRWTVLYKVNNSDHGKRSGPAFYMCICECGTERVVDGGIMRKGDSKSCGCLKKEYRSSQWIKHGLSRHPSYHAWHGMMARCYIPATESYSDYGARGITVCERWHDVRNFVLDMGIRPSSEYSIERIDYNGNYEPNNCKWAKIEEQNRNRRIDKRNTSGYKGISWAKSRNRWFVYINRKTIGHYKTLEEAIQARKDAELKYWGTPT